MQRVHRRRGPPCAPRPPAPGRPPVRRTRAGDSPAGCGRGRRSPRAPRGRGSRSAGRPRPPCAALWHGHAALAHRCSRGDNGRHARRRHAKPTDRRRHACPDPEPGPGEVLVKTLACGICGSDLHALTHADKLVEAARESGAPFGMDPSRDIVMGHEFCAEVIDYGPDTTGNAKPGERVVSMPLLFRGMTPHGIGYSNEVPGGYGELMVLAASLALPVPNGLVHRARRAHRAHGRGLARGREGAPRATRRGAGRRVRSGRPGGHRGAEAARRRAHRRRATTRPRGAPWRERWAHTSSSIRRSSR